MRNFLLILMLMLLMAGAVNAEQSSILFAKANQAYNAQNYQESARLYLELVEQNNLKTSTVFYNLGNAFYKQGSIGRAVFYYEKALLLHPRSAEINQNLVMARAKTLDRIDSTVPFVSAVASKLLAYFSVNEIAWTFWILQVSFILMTLLILNTSSNYRVRTVYFYALIPLFLLITAVFGLKCFVYEYSSKGIIIVEKIEVKSGPSETFQTLFSIHEGLKFSFSGAAQSGWQRIELDNGNNGWIPGSASGRINPL